MNKIEGIMTNINFTETEYINAHLQLKLAKEDLDMKTAQLQLETDWGEQGITNAEGRKAYITLNTQDLKLKVLECEKKTNLLKAEVDKYKREYEYELILLQQDNPQ